MSKKIGIFRTTIGIPSEAFIAEQFNAYDKFHPKIICRDDYGNLNIDKKNILEIKEKIKKNIWTCTRNPYLFDDNVVNSLDIIHAHFGPDGVMIYPLARKLSVPLVVTYHGIDITVDHKYRIFSKKPTDHWYRLKENDVIRDGAAFIAVSDFIVKKLIDRGYQKNKIHKCYIGVDTNKFSPLCDNNLRENYILCVGRHIQKKGIDKVLKAWSIIEKNHPNTKLIQIGSGPLTDDLKKLSNNLNISHRVNFMGACKHSVVLDMMKKCQIFALTSEESFNGDSEALGIVFNEAAACGVPIISTNHGGIPEAVIHKKTGLLSEPGNVVELAENIDKLLKNKNMRYDYGLMGREHVIKNFNIKTQTKNLENIYESLK